MGARVKNNQFGLFDSERLILDASDGGADSGSIAKNQGLDIKYVQKVIAMFSVSGRDKWADDARIGTERLAQALAKHRRAGE